MKVETRFMINKLIEDRNNSVGKYGKEMYSRMIKLLEKGYCPTCKRKMKK